MRKPMQVVIETLIEKHGVADTLCQAIQSKSAFLLKIENGSWMPLSIEVTPAGEVAVAHTFVQNGDLMYDPELVFDPNTWHVVEITMHPTGYYQRVPEGKYSPGMESFARTWAQNLRAQGFLGDRATKVA